MTCHEALALYLSDKKAFAAALDEAARGRVPHDIIIRQSRGRAYEKNVQTVAGKKPGVYAHQDVPAWAYDVAALATLTEEASAD